MAETYVAGDSERLPWLTDDVVRTKKSGGWIASFLAASAVALIAALSFWLGMSGGLGTGLFAGTSPDVRTDLPPVTESGEAVLLEPGPVMPQVEPSPASPDVSLPREPELSMEAPPVRRVASSRAASARRSPAASPRSAPQDERSEEAPSLYANPWKSTGVSGRMVRVGAYPSLEKGKEAWERLAQISPAIAQLPAVVTDLQAPNGRTLYWLQIGTTSQAHSEVLCQRMRAIRQSCVVVDVAGAQKGSKDERQPVGI